MPKRQRKIYSRPRKRFDKKTIQEENALINRYGLKTRREVWKADFAIRKMRNIAKKLITASEDEKKSFIAKHKTEGFAVETISDVLALTKEDYLKRRLQSVVVKKGMATTHKQARQFITHKHVSINGSIINTPSHLTTSEEESSITIDVSLPSKKELTSDEKELLEQIKHKGEEK